MEMEQLRASPRGVELCQDVRVTFERDGILGIEMGVPLRLRIHHRFQKSVPMRMGQSTFKHVDYRTRNARSDGTRTSRKFGRRDVVKKRKLRKRYGLAFGRLFIRFLRITVIHTLTKHSKYFSIITSNSSCQENNAAGAIGRNHEKRFEKKEIRIDSETCRKTSRDLPDCARSHASASSRTTSISNGRSKIFRSGAGTFTSSSKPGR